MRQDSNWIKIVIKCLYPVLIVMLSIGIAIPLTGCGGSDATPTPAVIYDGVIGETVTIGDATFQIPRITRSVGDQITRTKRGRTWALVTIEIENKGNSTLEFDPASFTVMTSSGETVKANPDIRFLPMLQATQVESGNSIEGKVGFDVPENDELVLKWEPSWADESITINLVKPE